MARSRKRSGSSGRPTPPEPLVFFVDRCLGKHAFPRPLIDAGLWVELHDDHFAPDCPDEEWLAEVGRRGWIVITRDLRIRYRAVEREAVYANGVRVISLTARRLPAADLGRAFVAAIRTVKRFVEREGRPFIATMTGTGEVRLVDDRG